jgi:ribosomal protein S27E
MARPQNRLNINERAVLGRATGRRLNLALTLTMLGLVGAIIGGTMAAFVMPFRLHLVILAALVAPAVAVDLFTLVIRYPLAAADKVLGFDRREQNRAEGVIYHFYKLRITRTELIKGYETDALRIPLRGLTATKTDDGRRVHITINGPDTKFVYSMAANSAFTNPNARQFAALLNYEAGLLGAPQKKAQEKRPPASGVPKTEAHEKSTKVRCLHCQHVQTVPVSQATFLCEQCGAHLKRSTAPANSS